METNTLSSRISLSSLLGPLLILVGGGLIGLAAAVVGSLFYIVLVFPVAMGVAAGWLVSRAVRAMKIRAALPMIALSVLAAAAIYGSYHYGRYIALQVQTWLELSSSTSEQVDLKVARIFVDYALKEETGYTGFSGYLLYKAKSGISIGRFYSQNRLALTSVFAWLYWLLELGVILWIARGMGERQMRKPACECCGSWLGGERHLGGTVPANESLLLDLLRRSDLVELGRLIGQETGLPSLELYLQGCEACGQGGSTLTVRRASLGSRGLVEFSEVSKAALRPGEGALFLQQLGCKAG